MGRGCCPGGKLTDSPASPQLQVKLLEVMEGVDKETFEFKFGKELTFTTVLSDQQVVELIPGGTGIVVEYEDRSRFIQLVRKARLEESKEQVGEQEQQALPLTPEPTGRRPISTLMLASMTAPHSCGSVSTEMPQCTLKVVSNFPRQASSSSLGGSHAGRSAEGGTTGCAGLADLARVGKEGVWGPRGHCGCSAQAQ